MAVEHISDVYPASLDYSVLSHDDLVNIVLQRSEVLNDMRNPGDVIRAWADGDSGPLDAVVSEKGAVLAQRAVQLIRAEFEALRPVLDRIAPKRIADIGCGYAVFDLYAHSRYGCDLMLIDVEENERRHFGFEEEAAAYTSLDTAQRFLIANGVPAGQVATWNPELNEPDEAAEKVDLAVSFLSCGFHFPVDMYMPFFRFGVAPGGSVILDLRAYQFQESKRMLRKLGSVQVLSEGHRRKRVLLRKGQG